MTTITIELSGDIAQQARRQGLRSAQAIRELLANALQHKPAVAAQGQREQVASAMARLREIGQGASLGMDARQEDGMD